MIEEIKNISTLEHRELIAKGSGEKLSLSAVLSSIDNFKDIFVTHEILLPGRKDSSPHYHYKKEEMIFVLYGSPTLYIGDKKVELNVGDFIGIAPSQEPHYLENATNSEARFLKICSNPKDDKVNYKK